MNALSYRLLATDLIELWLAISISDLLATVLMQRNLVFPLLHYLLPSLEGTESPPAVVAFSLLAVIAVACPDWRGLKALILNAENKAPGVLQWLAPIGGDSKLKSTRKPLVN